MCFEGSTRFGVKKTVAMHFNRSLLPWLYRVSFYAIKKCLNCVFYSVVAWGGAGGTWVPPIILAGTFNLVSGQALVPIHQLPTFTLLFSSMCSFQLDKAWKLFIYGFNKEKLSAQSTLLKWEINTLGRLKMPFQRPYSSKFSRGACPRPSLAACAFGARVSPPPPPPPANLATAPIYELGLNFVIVCSS